MKQQIKDFFFDEGIEYYSALSYSDVKEINSSLAERSGINMRSVIIFLIPYYTDEAENISVYSSSKDYHLIIKDITDRLIKLLSQLYPDHNFRGFGDHSPINEIDAALAAGLGIVGDNGLIINEKYGSYVFAADVITDIPPEELGAEKRRDICHCIGCGDCAESCPTGILRAECDKCLSAITQTKGELNDDDIELMRRYGTVWGCDICQSVCPYNKEPKKTPIPFFFEERISRLSTDIIEGMSDEEFKKRAFAWRGRKIVLRNLKYLDM